MELTVQELLGDFEVDYYIDGEILYYFNDSNQAAFFYDPTCKIKSEKDLGKYLRLINFFLSCFNIESVNPFDIVFKIRLNRDARLIQFEKAFSSKRMFFTDKACKAYLKKMKSFQYGDFFFMGPSLEISIDSNDFTKEQIDNLISKDFLKLVLINKTFRKKPYLSNEDISFFKINIENKDVFV